MTQALQDDCGGAALLSCLVLLGGVAMFSVTAANLTLQGEKSARFERERQIAFQAAEAALADAELDIRQSGNASPSRSVLFASDRSDGFVQGCGAGATNRYQGLCLTSNNADHPVWLSVDFFEQSQALARAVAYGSFTGRALPVGAGSLPSRVPRYIIELLPFALPGEGAESVNRSWFYRITAMGFGPPARGGSTAVMLQSHFRKEG